MIKPGTLVFSIKNSHFSLSNLSNFLRLLQAKIREDSKDSDFGKKYFNSTPKPTLKLNLQKKENSEKIKFEFFFSQNNSQINLVELSEYAFNNFFDELTVTLKSDPQQSTLWGISSKSIKTIKKNKSNSRLITIWEILTRLGTESIRVGNSVIDINGDSVKISRK